MVWLWILDHNEREGVCGYDGVCRVGWRESAMVLPVGSRYFQGSSMGVP